MLSLAPEDLPLQRIYRWERERATQLYLSQPMGGGIICEWTWAQAIRDSRRVAAYLQAQQWPAGSRIAILSKNCAHWVMADFAIWMAGHVSVPLYPTLAADSVRQILEHAAAKALFIGKLDAWPSMQSGVPDEVLRIATPLSPANAADGGIHWDRIL
ncbi:MAG: AMP-binding acetyl-CoA synthetase, partial [Nevskia sp.]|nr:AMP-binding acetyl-CoA synthetase [Nevskia sp.]